MSDDFQITVGLVPGEKGNGWGIWINNYSKYIGQFVNDEWSGIGTLTYNTGVKYEGEWFRNRFHGRGSITYADGIQYEGQWNKNQPGCMDCFIF